VPRGGRKARYDSLLIFFLLDVFSDNAILVSMRDREALFVTLLSKAVSLLGVLKMQCFFRQPLTGESWPRIVIMMRLCALQFKCIRGGDFGAPPVCLCYSA
jgi:hypothetical protein